MIVNQSGYAVQLRDADGIHCYQIEEILHTINNCVNFHVKGKKPRVFHFNLEANEKLAQKCAEASSKDATEKNQWLNSTFLLTRLIEQYYGQKLKRKQNLIEKLGLF